MAKNFSIEAFSVVCQSVC